MAEKILQSNVVDEYVRNMQIYAIAVNRKQSVPDIKDGLKTVHRRVMYIMYKSGLWYNKPYSKCAGVIGDTLKYVHPHGDTSVYGVIVDLANWFDSKIPLIDGHGNYGNMMGDGPAAYRYTECRLSEFGQECVISDLKSFPDVVDWTSNFNDSGKEPEYLPVNVPLLLINGTFGIGVGMKVEIPKHNIGEVIDATVNLIKNPNAPVVLIPDHCMPCDIIDTNWKQICNTGNGTYRVRAHIDIEYNKNGVPSLVIKSVPDMVTLFLQKSTKEDQGVIAAITKMVKEGKLPYIVDILNETNDDDLRYVLKLKPGTDAEYVKQFLYKNTRLENTYRVNFEVLDGIDMFRCSYKAYLERFIDFRISVKSRYYASEYQKCKTEWTQLQLYLKVMKSGELETIRKMIGQMKNVSSEAMMQLVEKIIKMFDVTDIEAKYILNMDYVKQAPGYIPIYEARCKALEETYTHSFNMLTNEELIKQEIIDELLAIKKKYNRPRLCKVVKAGVDDVPQGTFKVVVTENNFIKKIGPDEDPVPFKGDQIKFVMKVENTENIILFNKYGKAFKYPVHKIQNCAKNAQGQDIKLLIKNCTSQVISMIYEPTILELSKSVTPYYLAIVTEGNNIKKIDIVDLLQVPPSGLFYTKLAEGDCVKDLAVVPNGLDVILYSDKKALRFPTDDIPLFKRTALGSTAMNCKEPIDGLATISPDSLYILVLTKKGKINRFDIAGLAKSTRGKSGSKVIKLVQGDDIHSIYGVRDTDVLHVDTIAGTTEIPVTDIPVTSSISPGSKFISDTIIKAYIK